MARPFAPYGSRHTNQARSGLASSMSPSERLCVWGNIGELNELLESTFSFHLAFGAGCHAGIAVVTPATPDFAGQFLGEVLHHLRAPRRPHYRGVDGAP
jgi:hypothetical protein